MFLQSSISLDRTRVFAHFRLTRASLSEKV